MTLDLAGPVYKRRRDLPAQYSFVCGWMGVSKPIVEVSSDPETEGVSDSEAAAHAAAAVAATARALAEAAPAKLAAATQRANVRHREALARQTREPEVPARISHYAYVSGIIDVDCVYDVDCIIAGLDKAQSPVVGASTHCHSIAAGPSPL